MGNSESVWKEIKRKTNAKGGNPASPRNPKKSVRQAASRSSTLVEIKTALEVAGIEFIGTPDDGPGIRLRAPRP